MTNKVLIKSTSEIEIMAEGGKKLARVKKILRDKINIGVSAIEIENLAVESIKKVGGKASFKLVPGYSWATCVNVNAGIVHGIPNNAIIFKKGDIVSVDIGLFYKGFHTDTSFTVGLEAGGEKQRFLETGKTAFENAVKKAKIGNYVYDVSKAIEDAIVEKSYQPIRALVGHGVGKDLHEEPQIPCFVSGKRRESIKFEPGMTVAIEVMYALGSPNIALSDDGWTISTSDGKISALFEETVAITKNGPMVLT